MRRHGIQSLLPTQLRLPQSQPLTGHDHRGVVREGTGGLHTGSPPPRLMLVARKELERLRGEQSCVMVPKPGVEPGYPYGRWYLKPVRLPVPPLRLEEKNRAGLSLIGFDPSR